jgi:hypothetical protein
MSLVPKRLSGVTTARCSGAGAPGKHSAQAAGP